MSISLEQAERMYDRLYNGCDEYEDPDYNPVEEAMDRAIDEASMEEWELADNSDKLKGDAEK